MCLGESNHSTWRYSVSLATGRFTQETSRHTLLHLFFSVLIVFSLLFASTPEVCAAEVTLAWDPNPEPAVQGYRVYYGKASGYYTNVVDAGNRTEYVIQGLEAGTTYFFACTAYSATGDESNFSGEIVYATGAESSESSGSRAVVRCFIATAAYGSGLAPEVSVLRGFRDRHLLTNGPGQAFVEWYYRVSPPVAAFIAEHESLKTAVRWALAPVVFSIKYPFLLPVALGIVGLILVGRRSRR
jgi:hypothetical protein